MCTICEVVPSLSRAHAFVEVFAVTNLFGCSGGQIFCGPAYVPCSNGQVEDAGRAQGLRGMPILIGRQIPQTPNALTSNPLSTQTPDPHASNAKS